MMSTSAMRTGLATAFVACGVAAGPQLAVGQARVVSLSVPVRLVSAGCTLATNPGGAVDMLMNCAGVVTSAPSQGGITAVGGAVRTSLVTGSSALSVVSTSSAVRGSYGTATLAGWVNPALSSGPSAPSLGPATIAPAGTVEPAGSGAVEPVQDLNRPRSGPDVIGEDTPMPAAGDVPPVTGEYADAQPTFRQATLVAHGAQISRVQMDGRIQMLVVF